MTLPILVTECDDQGSAMLVATFLEIVNFLEIANFLEKLSVFKALEQKTNVY